MCLILYNILSDIDITHLFKLKFEKILRYSFIVNVYNIRTPMFML